MFKNIIGTIGTRVLTAVLTLAAWILNANYLDPEQVGTISLIIFSVAIIQLFTNFVSGAALIYMTPRCGIYKLFVPAYSWSLVVGLLTTLTLHLIGVIFPSIEIIPAGYFIQVLFLLVALVRPAWITRLRPPLWSVVAVIGALWIWNIGFNPTFHQLLLR